MGGQFAGAGSSAVGSYFGAASQKSALGFQAGMDDLNAAASERTAQAALLAGQRQEQAIRLGTAQLKSKQVTAMAANGIDPGAAGAARVTTSTEVMGELDADQANANAVRAAWGYRTQATNSRNDALLRETGADAISPFTSAVSSLLTSAGTVAKSWYQLKKSGYQNPGVAGGSSDSWSAG